MKSINWIYFSKYDSPIIWTNLCLARKLYNYDKRNYVDFSAGIIAFSEKHFGVAVHHLTQLQKPLRGSDVSA